MPAETETETAQTETAQTETAQTETAQTEKESRMPEDRPPAPEPNPPKWSWNLPGGSGAERSGASVARRALPRSEDFRRTVLFTVAGAVLPGLGLIAARRRLVGAIVLGLFVATLAAVGVYALVDFQGLLQIGVNPGLLRRVAVGLVIVGALWVGVVVATHLALRRRPSRGQRVVGGILVGVLAFAVAAPMAVAARTAYVQAGLVGTVFKNSKDTRSATRPTMLGAPQSKGAPARQDPWAGKPRLNVLLLGGDAGKGRSGTRTDTVILASIDTASGDTTLFSLPRNTARMPFPPKSPLHKTYPNGFTNGNGENAEYFLNAMYDNVPNAVGKDVLGETDNVGADVMKLSVGEALGLKVDYYVLINLQGFAKMIDALGGVRLNINTYIPMGGNTDLHIPPKEFLHPGPNQELNGRSTLWYARGRYGSDDFARMDRQRCVINAIVKQANPANVLARYEDIAGASKSIVYTDLPQEVLPAMVDLSLRVKDAQVRSVVFKNGEKGFFSANPDFPLMRQQVKKALGETTSANASPATNATATNAPTTDASAKPKKDSGGGAASEDVGSTCKYDPKVAATARPYTG